MNVDTLIHQLQEASRAGYGDLPVIVSNRNSIWMAKVCSVEPKFEDVPRSEPPGWRPNIQRVAAAVLEIDASRAVALAGGAR